MSEIQEKIRQYVKNVDHNWNYITPKELRKRIQNNGAENLFLLDIRKPENYAEGHIPGSTNIFWLDLFKPENLEKLPKDKTIVLICYVGHTASQAMTLLRLLGYNVIALKFGMGISPVAEVPISGWTDLGFETQSGDEKMEELRFSSESEALQYLADLTGQQIKIAAEENIDEKPKEEIEGGMAQGLSIQAIANKHGVSPKKIQKELAMGMKVEMEHTDDPEKVREIALDHLVEFPDYYTRLKEMENEAEKESESEKKSPKEND